MNESHTEFRSLCPTIKKTRCLRTQLILHVCRFSQFETNRKQGQVVTCIRSQIRMKLKVFRAIIHVKRGSIGCC